MITTPFGTELNLELLIWIGTAAIWAVPVVILLMGIRATWSRPLPRRRPPVKPVMCADCGFRLAVTYDSRCRYCSDRRESEGGVIIVD